MNTCLANYSTDSDRVSTQIEILPTAVASRKMSPPSRYEVCIELVPGVHIGGSDSLIISVPGHWLGTGSWIAVVFSKYQIPKS